MIKVFIADDHPLVRQGLRQILSEKMKLKTNAEIIRYAIENGLIE